MDILEKKIITVNMLDPKSVSDYAIFLIENPYLRGEIIEGNGYAHVTMEFTEINGGKR